ncbi:MAG: leucine-rich repeat domain-containing protein [Lachnospiraceae bacterium]|nr:leucine-rich repeat domain-containing protein [Lachnospiraceae bacterium]
MESFGKTVQKKMQIPAVRYICMTAAITGISLLLYGCGKGASIENTMSTDTVTQASEDTVSADTVTRASEDTGAEQDNDGEAFCIREKTKSSGEDSAEGFKIPLLEQLFTYEEAENASGQYLVITGIAEKYREQFIEFLVITGISENYQEQYMRHMIEYPEWLDTQSKYLQFPAEVNGLPVREIGAFAFADIKMDGVELSDSIEAIGEGAFRNTGITKLRFSQNLKTIGKSAFENCSLERLAFPEQLSSIGSRAFAGNTDLWTVLIHKVDVAIGLEAFADCSADFLLCYGDDTDGMENLAAEYAGKNGLDSMEIMLSKTPVIHYPPEPYVLQPRIDSFFYGDYGDWEGEQWCTWEQDENAPNFGYSDWQWIGCSSWCGVTDFELTVEASSELASANGRYSAENVLVQNRDAAWVEGADGYGIGESITYRQRCTTSDNNKWEMMRPDCLAPEYDGFMRYTEICIVNGYAKDQKTWAENGRIRRLNMYVEDKPYACLELADTILPQYFTLPEEDIKVLSGGMIEVRFEIADVYPGSVYEDTCLTGLVMEFRGRHAH